MKIDLHIHSTFSDGTLEPEETVDAAAGCGITCMSLADHDCIGGIERARGRAEKLGIRFIPGVELNTKDVDFSIHILGYLIDENDANFQKSLAHNREIRSARIQAIIEKLSRLGMRMTLPDFTERSGKSSLGRPHIADRMKELGLVFSRQEAFDKYLGRGRPAYIPYEGPTPQQAIEIIMKAGGIPVLAHPGHFAQTEQIESMVKLGLQGIEVYYPSHSTAQTKHFAGIAKKYGLLATGGSDYHGPDSGHERLGEIDVPEKTVDDIFERKHKLFGQ